jgi:hypothetical protein
MRRFVSNFGRILWSMKLENTVRKVRNMCNGRQQIACTEQQWNIGHEDKQAREGLMKGERMDKY